MPELTWPKSMYSAQGANCVYVAATPSGTVHLHESDDPAVILTTTRSPLLSLIRTLKENSQRR
ncbi:DUF397 domain-containing protein [Streptomyces avermitilis]|uniref:DUF397 domain-containing protein n=1 Tax=Streptomyces avermitilis TaxID=33903 RepID=UPI003828C5DC